MPKRIKLPGFPPRWRDETIVRPDKDARVRPRGNHHKMLNSSFPLEPLFRALYTENPEYNMHDVDLVIDDAFYMKHLLEAVEMNLKNRFQMQAEVVRDKTVLLTDCRRPNFRREPGLR